MRRLTAALAAILVLAGSGCRKKQPVQYVEEGSSQLSTAVNVADPRTAVQLLRGFYDLESNAWRWTASRFAFALRPPKDAATSGVTLFLEFTIPEVFLRRVGPTTLTAAIDGKPLPSQTYSQAGNHKYEQKVPAELLKADVVTAEFALDKFLPAGAVEQRELGLIVTLAGLRSEEAPPAPPAKDPAPK
jgi:hypothetical protein